MQYPGALSRNLVEPLDVVRQMLDAVCRATGATRMIPIASAHIVLDAFAMGNAGADFIESLAERGGRFVVPTTINSISYDRLSGPGSAADDILGIHGLQKRMLDACEYMGAMPTCSCNPFSQGISPLYGQHVAWSESATTAYINSILGAHSNREGATAIASAITGLTPSYGMHEKANRYGTHHFSIETDINDRSELQLLGALIARRANGQVPVISGLNPLEDDEAFGFSASFSIIGNSSMFHICGMTPDASTLAAAFNGKVPQPIIITSRDLDEERARYETGRARQIDMVAVGAPHATIKEIHQVARLLDGRKIDSTIDFVITTNRGNYAMAEIGGLLSLLSEAGVRVTADRSCFGCDVVAGKFAHKAVLATNSLKAAYSAPGTREVEVCYGSLSQCVEAAVAGIWTPQC